MAETREPWDDGFVPQFSRAPTELVRQTGKAASNFLGVFDDVLDSATRAELLRLVEKHEGRPWGVYIPLKEVSSPAASDASPSPEHSAARAAVAQLFFGRCTSLHPDLFAQGGDAPAHGVAVWCLASDVGASVQYHIDYAELHRLETNVIVPPLYAATVHVSDLESNCADDRRNIGGGALVVNCSGLDHYRSCGYKGRLVASHKAKAQSCSATDFTSAGWLRIPFKANRAIVHDGEWPHASERVDSLPPGVKRVIVGFNVFGSNVAEANLRAPEHSAQFNSTVKRYQLASKLAPVADKPEDASIDLHALRSNPVLSRLLVSLGRAKREVECAASTAPKAGDAVDALWKSGLRMWPARIHVAHGDGTFDVVYADGHAWIKAPRSAIRSKPNKPAD